MAKKIDPQRLKLGLATGAILGVVLILLSADGRPDLAYPVATASIAIAFAIHGRWELRGHRWFWLLITGIVGAHIYLILSIPWKSGWIPAPIILLFCIVDLAIVYMIIGFVEKLMNKYRGGPVERVE